MHDGGFRVAVLSPDMALIAAFTSPIEACRYAALISEPSYQPVLRRIADGADIRFSPTTSSSAVADWIESGKATRRAS